jgi:hypothetical protein
MWSRVATCRSSSKPHQMTKRASPTIEASDLAEYLASQDDFALELFVYSRLMRAGFDASHGGTYQDRVTQRYRQYDIRAGCRRGDRAVQLAVECKALRPSFPLLVSRVPRTSAEAAHEIVVSRFSEQLRPGIGIDWVPAATMRVASDRGLYPFESLVGRSLTQVGRNRDGDLSASDAESFEKWSQALSSASDLVQQACMAAERSAGKEFATFVLPVLVVSDGTLWVADYASAGELVGAPRQEDHVTFSISRRYDGPNRFAYEITHLHFLTRSGASAFFDRIGNDPTFWDAAFPQALFPNVSL